MHPLWVGFAGSRRSRSYLHQVAPTCTNLRLKIFAGNCNSFFDITSKTGHFWMKHAGGQEKLLVDNQRLPTETTRQPSDFAASVKLS
jgi:hypothetical protein